MILSLLVLGLSLVVFVHAVAAASAWQLWRRWATRGRPGAKEALALLAVSGGWSLIYLVEIVTPVPYKVGFAIAEAGTAALVPFAWAAFLLGLTRQLHGRRGLALWGGAAAWTTCIVLAAATQPWHGLYWGETELFPHAGFSLFETPKGPLSLAALVGYGLAAAACGYLGLRLRHVIPGMDAPLFAIVYLGAAAPFLAAVVEDAGIAPLDGLDLEPFANLFPGLVLLLLVRMLDRWDLTQQARALLFDATPDGIVVLSLDGRIWDINRAAEVLIGAPEGVNLGRRFAEIWPNAPSLTDGFADSVVHGRTLEVVAFSLKEDGVRAGTAIVLRDVTESRAAATRGALADRLGQMGIVTTGLAHEINNPLAVVMVGIEHAIQVLDKSGSPPDLARMALTDAYQAAGQLKAVARSLRDFAHLDDEPVRSVLVPDALERAITVLGRNLTAHAVIERLFEEVPPVRLPPGRLEQVLVALLRNASQALEGRPGPERLILRILQDPGEVVIEVQDTGPGMRPDVLERAFEPFFTTRGHGGGTGLGLYVARALVERYGGRLTLDSSPGRGTRARVRLPASQESHSPSPLTTEVQRDRPVARRRILIVDDDPRVGKALGRLLHEHDVTVVLDGAQAVQAMAKSKFDLILCDVMMPKMSGMEVYETACDVDPTLGDSFVFITGGTFTPEATAFLDRFPGRVLEKPIAAAALREAIRRGASP